MAPDLAVQKRPAAEGQSALERASGEGHPRDSRRRAGPETQRANVFVSTRTEDAIIIPTQIAGLKPGEAMQKILDLLESLENGTGIPPAADVPHDELHGQSVSGQDAEPCRPR